MAFYTTLDTQNKEIRLLVLHPGTIHESLRCSLSVVSLQHVPTYEALSYVWGLPDSNISVDLDGQAFQVTLNLHAVLKRLRDNDLPRTLWVDAICINQADTAEKNVQVALMGHIYSYATRGLLWLGEEPDAPVPTVTSAQAEEVDRLILQTDEFLAKLTSAMDQWQDPNTRNILADLQHAMQATAEPHSDDFVITRTRPHTWYGDERDLPALSEAVTHPGLSADSIFQAFALFRLLASDRHLDTIPYLTLEPDGNHTYLTHARRAAHWLVTRSWWSRIWTVQECILPRRCTILYGPVSMPWDVLLDGLLCFRRHRDTCCAGLPGVHDMLNLHVETALELGALRVSRERVSLARLLPKFRHRGATDPRDKVYALLPLVTEWYGAAPLVPVYDKPVAEVYTETAGKIIRNSRSLDILCRPPEQPEDKRLQDLPSWVMDLSQPVAAGGTLDRLEKQIPLYNACGSILLGDVTFHDGGRVLALEGIIVDRIKRASTIMTHWNQATARGTIEWWYEVAEEEVGTTDTEWRETLARTLCGDTVLASDDRSRPAEFRRADGADYGHLNTWLETIRLGVLHEPDGGGEAGSLSHVVKATTQMRAFIISEGGHMGLVPNMARLTFPRPDEIFVFPGAKTPFILRDVGIRDIPGVGLKSCHMFLGDCYLQGFMDGEAMGAFEHQKQLVYIV